MKRKNIILSALLSLSIIASSSCFADDYSSTIVKSDVTAGIVSEELSDTTSSVADTEAETTAFVSEAEVSTSASSFEATEVTEDISETSSEMITTSVAIETEAETTFFSDVVLTSEEATTTTEVTTTEAQTTESTTEATKPKTEETTVTTTETAEAEKKYIALTFDDGPNTTTTNEVLDVLEQYGIKASFFLVGNNINSNTESVVKRAYDMGCEIGNHSKSHSYLNELTAEEVKAEVDYVNEYVVRITGEAPKFFRPPYIAISPVMYDAVDMPFICGFGCNDWDDKIPAERRSQVILRQVQDGGIILLHDSQGNSQTVEALHSIITELQSQGYEFVTVSELFKIKNVEIRPDDSGLYTFVGQ